MNCALETRKGRPIATKENILKLMHNHNTKLQLIFEDEAIQLANVNAFSGFQKQVQLISDIATQHDFYRDGLQRCIKAALSDARWHLWQAAKTAPKGKIATLTINAQ
ncbi:hypothetical protein GU254_09460 [Vibrio cholerae]|uniref:hypothetical protein n=1 Tax=Vibrio paracholerae TaxID=650003 RepID=UPI0019D10D63|nr:hypothetical protein [Vibrio paracholerae]MBN7278984.1 hypothetical protein [Vibrio paracholerae]MBN7281680.1 hypothetical protein [Vibrio paracholerae]